MTIGIIAISIFFMLIGMLVQFQLKSKFTEYSKIPTSSGLSGSEIAQKMLLDNGIYDVQVISTPGFLSDHYDPAKKTINLSEDVYYAKTVSAAAIAAHECGHAVTQQTGTRYTNQYTTFPVGNIGRTWYTWFWWRQSNCFTDRYSFVCCIYFVYYYNTAGRV